MNILLLGTIKREIVKETTYSRSFLIYVLARGLIQKGHKVSIMTTGNSSVEGATIIPIMQQGLKDMPAFENPFYAETSYLVQMAKKTEQIGESFDVIHNHTPPEFLNLFASDRIKTPIVSTIHLYITPQLDEALSLFKKAHVVAISNTQKEQLKKTKAEFMVYNGIDTKLFVDENKSRDYFLFVGRISMAKDRDNKYIDQKGLMHAISVAKKANVPLKIVGAVEDINFYKQLIEPNLSEKIQFVGEVTPLQLLSKNDLKELYQRAKALLYPLNIGEPFGLTVIEAQACGTPVIAFNRGCISELLIDGKTGFIVENEDQIIEAIGKIDTIKREDCRKHVENTFTIDKMVDGYEKVYQKLING